MAEENTDNQYVVLARKYRPQTFEDLLGQDALVQTLTNAIKNNRLHHAYILTGIRGVGKTTTARLIARALNCTGLDGKGGPTIHPCGVCENCRAIAAGRHIDVMELDAASRTGVDDMRELLDGVRYKPTNARYKVYIIDEVHMLSKGAFNALLKTLEEPPAHVKFIFATTEIRKVPVTILSRCQRFDLQRLSIETLMQLFHKIIAAENLKADEEALEMVARAADGSARDGLSMLDQAIVLGDGKIKTETVIEMIGLADRTQTLALFEHLIAGSIPDVLKNLQLQYKNGANPMAVLQDLIDVTHMLTKAKIVPAALNTEMLSENDRELCTKLAGSLSVAVLSRMWQMMLKGLTELNSAPAPLDALEMILIRIAYSASLPTPAELLEEVKKKSDLNPIAPKISVSTPQIATVHTMPQPANSFVAKPTITPAPQPEVKPVSAPAPTPSAPCPMNNISQLAAYLEEHKKMRLEYSLKNDVSIENFGNWQIELTLSDKAPVDFVSSLRQVLTEATGGEWQIIQHRGTLGETLADKENAAIDADKRSAAEHPLVKAVYAEFKGARIDTITRKISETAPEDSDTEEENDKENTTQTYEEEE
ncbi:MAG: DNA polymerase III subunit gamma/tau [Alphaproteobacteria bacterium]|nr:DNA polymerase III subunit gamma/tau [Alphaproteobacteria bacterium]